MPTRSRSWTRTRGRQRVPSRWCSRRRLTHTDHPLSTRVSRRAAASAGAAAFVRRIIIASAAALAWFACQREGSQARAPSRPADGPATPPSAQPRSDSASWQADDFRADFDLRGTEPFWEATIRGQTIVLRFAAEEQDRRYANARLTASDSVATWTATSGSDTLVVTMRRGACDDGMSDQIYPFSVTLGGGITGCGYFAQWEEVTTASPPFDTVRTVRGSSDSVVTCYRHPRHFVVVRAVPEEAGSTLFVRALGRQRCNDDSLSGDFVWRNRGEADYLLGLRGDVLFIDSGTGAENRILTLIDLSTGRRLVELTYNEVDPGFSETSVRVWRGYSLERPAPGCTVPPSMGAGVNSLFAIDLRTGAVSFAGRTRCGVRQ